MLTEQIKQKAAEYAEYLTEFRRDLHRHPELSMQERRTAQKIEEALKQIPGMEVQAGLTGGVGVVGLLRGKKGPGKTVLLRADIDALPIQETTGLPFCSQNEGVMHACGHDGHTAWLLGAAKILADLQEEFCGCVKFVFQPGEEGGGGGRKMVQEENVLENPKADAVFAAHAWPEIPAGQVHVARRCGFGYPGSFAIQVIGRGGHGSWPSQCVDPIAVANQIYGGLQQIISRRLPETAARALSVCTIHSGPQDKSNIIPDCCTMTGTIRTDSEPAMQQMIAQIQQVAQGVAQANDARAEVTARYGGAVLNTPEAVRFCIQAAAKIVGQQNALIDDQPHLGGEDFAEYTSRAPGAYVFAGIATPETQGKFGLHSSDFVLAESVVPQMAAVFSQFAVDFLEKGGF